MLLLNEKFLAWGGQDLSHRRSERVPAAQRVFDDTHVYLRSVSEEGWQILGVSAVRICRFDVRFV